MSPMVLVAVGVALSFLAVAIGLVTSVVCRDRSDEQMQRLLLTLFYGGILLSAVGFGIAIHNATTGSAQ